MLPRLPFASRVLNLHADGTGSRWYGLAACGSGGFATDTCLNATSFLRPTTAVNGNRMEGREVPFFAGSMSKFTFASGAEF
jgi:hypothetical protein